jgi:hypothetical protein
MMSTTTNTEESKTLTIVVKIYDDGCQPVGIPVQTNSTATLAMLPFLANAYIQSQNMPTITTSQDSPMVTDPPCS